jgi:glycosyltransferase involved in cell wall biosynthesis
VRVLVVTNMYPTKGEPWFGSFVAEQVDALRGAGIDVDVLSFDGRMSRAAYARAARRVRALVATSSYDVVHAHYGLSGAVALAQRRVPVVTTFWGSDLGYVRWQRAISFAVARITTPVFVSRRGAERIGLEKAAVVPPSVDTRRFAPRPQAAARARLGWEAEGVVVLLPGSAENSVKGAELFARVVARVAESRPEVRPAYLEGFTRDEVVDVMNATDVMLMCSLSEGSPLAVKEALACCTPVVSVDVGDVAETIAGLPGCCVTERNERALASAVASALAAGRPEELRRRADQYAPGRTVERLLAVYREAQARHGGEASQRA